MFSFIDCSIFHITNENESDMTFFEVKSTIHPHKGASIYDVRTEGGGGVSPKEDEVREVA